MDDAQKKPQNQDPVTPTSGSIIKEVERPNVVTESIPEMKLDKEVKEAGVEASVSPDLQPHEIIKANVQLPIPAPLHQAVIPPLPPAHPVKMLKRKRINTDPTQAVTWEEEIEVREDSKKAA
ncbi:MAG TPA: hypothetical protein VKC89_01340 [Patescibacteria group bacterium]|nr:hypothetical protein [Patescibacteria group bacterium]